MLRPNAADLARMNEKNSKAGAKFKGFPPGEPEGIALTIDQANWDTVWPMSHVIPDACRRLGLANNVITFLDRELGRIPESAWRSGKPEVMASDITHHILPKTIEGYVDQLVMIGMASKRQDKAQIRADHEQYDVWVSFAPLGARFEYFALLAANFQADIEANSAAHVRARTEKKLKRKYIGKA